MKNLKNNLYKLFVILLAVLCMTAGLSACGSSDTARKTTISIALSDSLNENEVVLIKNNKTAVVSIEDPDGGMTVQESLDGSCLAFVNGETLFVTNGSKVTKVKEGVSSFLLSTYGKAIAYTDDDSSLYVYNISKDTSTKIDSEVYMPQISYNRFTPYVISPDGSAVLYNKADDSDQQLYLYVKGKQTKLAQGSLKFGPYPIAVSANGKISYAAETSGLYAFDREGNKKKIISLNGKIVSYSYGGLKIDRLDWNGFACFMNADCTDILFYDGDGTYISEDGEERIRLSKYVYTPLFVNGSDDYRRHRNDGYYNAVEVYYCTLDSFAERFYHADGDNDGRDIAYIDKSYKFDKVPGSGYRVRLTEDGYVFYIKNDSLYRVNKSHLDEPEKIGEDVEDAWYDFVAADKNNAYYISDDSLYFYNGKKTTIVDYDVDSFAYFASYGGVIYETDGILYFFKKGKKKKIVSEFYDYGVKGDVAYYLTGDSDDANIYVSTGSSFKLLIKNCSFNGGYKNFEISPDYGE